MNHLNKFIFAALAIFSLFILPEGILTGAFAPLAVTFMITFSLSTTALLSRIEHEFMGNPNKTPHSLVAAATGVLGFSSFHACGIGAAVCGSGAGLVIAAIFPSAILNFISEYGLLIISVSIVLQVFSLYHMRVNPLQLLKN